MCGTDFANPSAVEITQPHRTDAASPREQPCDGAGEAHGASDDEPVTPRRDASSAADEDRLQQSAARVRASAVDALRDASESRDVGRGLDWPLARGELLSLRVEAEGEVQDDLHGFVRGVVHAAHEATLVRREAFQLDTRAINTLQDDVDRQASELAARDQTIASQAEQLKALELHLERIQLSHVQEIAMRDEELNARNAEIVALQERLRKLRLPGAAPSSGPGASGPSGPPDNAPARGSSPALANAHLFRGGVCSRPTPTKAPDRSPHETTPGAARSLNKSTSQAFLKRVFRRND
jgi:hypothetical protein